MKKLKKKEIFARHGDLLVDEFVGSVGTLDESKTELVLAGSHGGRHFLPAGTLFRKLDRGTLVQVKEEVSIKHDSRHLPSRELQPGQVYRIYSQIERFGDGDVDVED